MSAPRNRVSRVGTPFDSLFEMKVIGRDNSDQKNEERNDILVVRSKNIEDTDGIVTCQNSEAATRLRLILEMWDEDHAACYLVRGLETEGLTAHPR